MARFAQGIGITLALAAACGAGHAQREAIGAREQRVQMQRPVLPSSVAKLKSAETAVLVIPDAELFRDLDLSAAQREALTLRLKSVPFQAFRRTLNEGDLAAQRLPSGEIFQVMRQPGFAPTTMQHTLPAPGLPADPCALPDHTDDEMAALRKVLTAQLQMKGGDVTGFTSGYPGACRRKQLLYLVKAAVVIAR